MSRHGEQLFGMKLKSIAAVLFAAFAGLPQIAKAQNAPPSQAQPSPKSSPAQTASQAPPSARPKMKTFASPQEAIDALYAAARNHDENSMLVILGPDSKDVVVWTDDPEERKADTDLFVEKYGQMHRLVKEPDNETTLYIGAENWPLPIPLVQKNGAWYFDSGLGRREIVFRRIGQNELETVDVLHATVDAENEYAAQMADTTGVHEYASRFNSEQGRRNGLYWPASKSPEESPIGPYLAQASFNRSDRKPLNGYFFRILTAQGPSAPDGARKFIIDGRMTGGFAFVAFPAVYRSSGVMTFIVGPHDLVYEKDLGPATAQLAKAMTSFNPDSTWSKVH